MKFEITYNNIIFTGNPIYIKSENSFLYEPWRNVDFSIMIGKAYSSLDVCLTTREVLQLTGCNPKASWIEKKLIPPFAKQGILKVYFDIKQIAGTGEYYTDDWDTYFDEKNGWVCIGKFNKISNIETVEFSRNTIAVLSDQQLIALWIKPIFSC